MSEQKAFSSEMGVAIRAALIEHDRGILIDYNSWLEELSNTDVGHFMTATTEELIDEFLESR